MTIYLVQQQNSNLYKIGVTSKLVEERVNQLQTANPETLLIIHQFKTKHDYRLEGYLHRRYTDKNVQLEWFELNQVEVDGFLAACRQGESNFDILSENTYVQDNASGTRKRNSYKGSGFTPND